MDNNYCPLTIQIESAIDLILAARIESGATPEAVILDKAFLDDKAFAKAALGRCAITVESHPANLPDSAQSAANRGQTMNRRKGH
jgi:hypothetical protein